MIDYEKFQKSLEYLQVQYENYSTLDDSQPELIQEAVKESVIQRFETCYDCMWKVLKRYLTEEFGIPETPNSPKPVFRLAHENQLMRSPVEQWLIYADTRTDTAHDYSGENAENALQLMEDFIDDAIGLYQIMTEKTWGS